MLKRPQSNTTCIYRLLFCCCPTVKISQTFQVTDVKKGVRKSMHRPAIVCQQSDRVITVLFCSQWGVQRIPHTRQGFVHTAGAGHILTDKNLTRQIELFIFLLTYSKEGILYTIKSSVFLLFTL